MPDCVSLLCSCRQTVDSHRPLQTPISWLWSVGSAGESQFWEIVLCRLCTLQRPDLIVTILGARRNNGLRCQILFLLSWSLSLNTFSLPLYPSLYHRTVVNSSYQTTFWLTSLFSQISIILELCLLCLGGVMSSIGPFPLWAESYRAIHSFSNTFLFTHTQQPSSILELLWMWDWGENVESQKSQHLAT